MTASALEDRCRHLMTVRRTTVEEHQFVPIAAGDIALHDRLIWGTRIYAITAVMPSEDRPIELCVVGEYGPNVMHLDLLAHEEVLVLLPRPTQPKEA